MSACESIACTQQATAGGDSEDANVRMSKSPRTKISEPNIRTFAIFTPFLAPSARELASYLKVDLVAAAGARLAEGVKPIRPIDHRAHHIAARAEQRHLPARTFLEII